MTNAAIPVVQEAFLQGGMPFAQYYQISQDLFAQGRSTSDDPHFNEPAMLAYVKLNLARMHRIYKTTALTPELAKAIEQVSRPQRWLLLTESWCGDASQITPVIDMAAQANPLINLSVYLRDQHPDLMNLFLTNGGKSIPKLVILNADNQVLATWGPRPEAAQQLFSTYKNSGTDYETIKQLIHTWYAHDKTLSTQKELTLLLSTLRSGS